MCFLGSNVFGTLWASWTSWKSISFARLGKFSFVIFSNKFSVSCSSFSPSGTPMNRMLERLKMSWRFLSLSSFFWILVSSFCSGWMFFLLYAPNCWFESRFPSRHCWFPVYFILFYFISLWVAFICSFIFRPSSISSVNILITSVLNCASDRLGISLSLSCIFSGAFHLFFHLRHFIFPWCTCYV